MKSPSIKLLVLGIFVIDAKVTANTNWESINPEPPFWYWWQLTISSGPCLQSPTPISASVLIDSSVLILLYLQTVLLKKVSRYMAAGYPPLVQSYSKLD